MPSNILESEVELNKTPRHLFRRVCAWKCLHTHPPSSVSADWVIWRVFVHLWGLSTVGLDLQECWSVALAGNPNLRWRLFTVWASGCYRIRYQCYPVYCSAPAGIFSLHDTQSEPNISPHTSPREQNSEEKWQEGVWWKIICPYRLKRDIWSLKKDRSGWKRWINVKNDRS